MRSLLVLVGLLGLVVLCHSYCTFTRFDSENPKCADSTGKVYSEGQVWTDGCHECNCESNGYSCCLMIADIPAHIPDGFEMRIDMKNCEAIVVSKEDHVAPFPV